MSCRYDQSDDVDSSPVYSEITAEKQDIPDEHLYCDLEATKQSRHLGMETNPIFISKDCALGNNKLEQSYMSPNPLFETLKSQGHLTTADHEYSHFISGNSQEMPSTYGKLDRPERKHNSNLDGATQTYSHLKRNHTGKKKAGHAAADPETSYSTLSDHKKS